MSMMGNKKHGQINMKSKHAYTIAQSTFSFYISGNGFGKSECLTGQNDSCDSVSNSEREEDENDNVHEEFFKKICNRTLLMPLIENLIDVVLWKTSLISWKYYLMEHEMLKRFH